MKREDIKKLQETSYYMSSISKGLALLENSDELYIISDYSYKVNLTPDDTIKIPQCLVQEFKQKLTNYFVERYNEFAKTLKDIEL